MIIQPIVNIAEICAQHHIKQAVICPGSRSAPLALAFVRHHKINTFVIPDERSAGFIGLGLAQSSNTPVAIICTSGTAAANLYPAIIEAFYQQVPLLIFTADRPPEWIDQQDGQTIRQRNMFQNHILASYQFPVSFDHEEAKWHAEKMVSEAILKASGLSSGPVHINIPIREPFYPSADEKYQYSNSLKVIKAPRMEMTSTVKQAEHLKNELKIHKKIMVLAGQSPLNKELINLLMKIQKNLKWVVVGDIIANIHGLQHMISSHDIILNNLSEIYELQPDLLITFGKTVLSKSLKTFIRTNQPAEHWQIGEDHEVIDAFKSLTKKVLLNPIVFFKIVEESSLVLNKTQNNYFNRWKEKELQANAFVGKYFKVEKFSEFHAVQKVIAQLPEPCHLHLANSMPVRYANFIGIENNKETEVWANRGTSGIDGCLSTALGHAINSSDLNVIVTGDMAFFYDRNALWHSHIPSNLRVVILNNHGGGIFRLLNGPKQLDELEEYFETRQNLNAANTARDFGMKYFMVKTMDALPGILEQFFEEKTGPSILEIETDPKINRQVFEDFNQKAIQLWD